MKTTNRMHTSISVKIDGSHWLPLCATWGHAMGRSIVVHIKLFRVSNSYTRFNSMYFLINICATWGNVDHALWIFTNQKLFYLCEHLDFGEPHVAPRLFNFLCCVVLLCLFLFVLCHVYSTVPVSLSCTFHIAPWIFSNFDLLETLFMTY